MSCENIEQLLPDYLAGALGESQRRQVQQHLESCLACREEVSLWTRLAALPQEQPSPRMRARFDAMLEAYQEGRAEKSPRRLQWRRLVPSGFFGGMWRSPAAGMAFALLFLVVGFFAGRSTTTPVTQPNNNSGELAAVRQEMSDMRHMVELALLQQQSATERLQAVSMTTQESAPDPKVLAALTHALRYDSSVNVRLAALDALSRYNNQPDVRQGLHDALQPQQSPLVQVALIDLMVELHDRSVVSQLKEFEKDSSVNPAVRQRAAWGVKRLA